MTADVKQPWTAGPWKAWMPVDEWVVSTDVDAGSMPLSITDEVGGLSPDEEEANAHLIAKAPKMAAALAAFVPIDDRFKSRGALGQTAPVDQPEIATARAILDAIGWRWGKEGGR